MEQAENNYDLEKAAKLQHGVLPRLEKDLTELQGLEKNKLLSDVVTSDDIAAVIFLVGQVYQLLS